jgi:hypothetical protein
MIIPDSYVPRSLLESLFIDRHILMQETDSSFSAHRNSHGVLRNRIHCGEMIGCSEKWRGNRSSGDCRGMDAERRVTKEHRQTLVQYAIRDEDSSNPPLEKENASLKA